MYFVYVLKSQVRNYTYIGISHDVGQRLARHNSGRNPTTKPYRPFILLHTETFPDRISARSREKWFKTGEGRELLKTFK